MVTDGFAGRLNSNVKRADTSARTHGLRSAMDLPVDLKDFIRSGFAPDECQTASRCGCAISPSRCGRDAELPQLLSAEHNTSFHF